MIITPTKINTGFIDIASACNSGCILNLVIINITTENNEKVDTSYLLMFVNLIPALQ